MIDETMENTSETVKSPEDNPTKLTSVEQSVSQHARRVRRRQTGVVSIGTHLEVETEAEKARGALLDLVESLKSRRVLTGSIQGIERSENSPEQSMAVLYHGDYKVIIPAEQMVELPENVEDPSRSETLFRMLNKRLGAEVDYVVKGMDPESGLAAASRLEAMATKRREYYFGTDREGHHPLHEGVCAEGRVVSVVRAGIFVEIFGVETFISLRELSYQRMLDATAVYQPGQRVVVKLLEILPTDHDHIKVEASVKQASANPYEKALHRYTVGNRYVGTVSMVDTTGVFVALDGGVDCLCSYPKRGRPPRGARVTVRILGINHDSNRIWGAITHIALPH